jgi:hypothetical protein
MFKSFDKKLFFTMAEKIAPRIMATGLASPKNGQSREKCLLLCPKPSYCQEKIHEF